MGQPCCSAGAAACSPSAAVPAASAAAGRRPRRRCRRPRQGYRQPRQRYRRPRRRGLRLGLGGLLGLGGRLLGGLLALEEVALPLGQRLTGGLLALAFAGAAAGRTGDEALGHGVGDHAGQQGDGADRVVVARDLVVDLVGVAVGVEDRHHRDVELARLADGDVLLLGVHDPDGAGHLLHLADTTEGLLQLGLLAGEDQQLLLGEARGGHVLEVDLLQLLEALQPLVDRREVGEHAAEPALVHVGHAHAGGLLGDGLLGLLLGADEHDGAAVGDGLLDELVGAVDVRQRLEQVDDVDAVALGEDEALHLRVPAAGLVPEVDAALQQLPHRDDGHGRSPWCTRLSSAEAGRPRLPDAPDAPPGGFRRGDRDRSWDRDARPPGEGGGACEVSPVTRAAPAVYGTAEGHRARRVPGAAPRAPGTGAPRGCGARSPGGCRNAVRTGSLAR